MGTLFVLGLTLAIFHLVYESVIAPELRLSIRFKIFQLRDRLRTLECEKLDEKHNLAFEVVDRSISNLLNRLPHINVVSIFALERRLQENKPINKKIGSDRKKVFDSNNKELKEIDQDLTKYALFALVINSGGWTYLILPLFLILILVVLLIGRVQRLKKWFREEVGTKISLAPKSHASMLEKAY